MKYLLLLLVIGVGLYVLLGRSRKVAPPPAPPAPAPPAAAPAPMLACAHCGVHLPRDESVVDAAGRAYCGEAHRLAGPR